MTKDMDHSDMNPDDETIIYDVAGDAVEVDDTINESMLYEMRQELICKHRRVTDVVLPVDRTTHRILFVPSQRHCSKLRLKVVLRWTLAPAQSERQLVDSAFMFQRVEHRGALQLPH